MKISYSTREYNGIVTIVRQATNEEGVTYTQVLKPSELNSICKVLTEAELIFEDDKIFTSDK